MIKMYDLNGKEIAIQGFKGLRLKVPSPSFDYEIAETEAGHKIITDRKLKPREIEAVFNAKATGYLDSIMLRDEIYSKVDGGSFYIADDNIPHKRWLVHFSDAFEPERMNHYMQNFTISLTALSGVAESEGTTLDLMSHNVEKWQYGMGLSRSDELLYIHEKESFRVYNAGDIAINPTNMPLKIVYTGESKDLKIQNNTNGTTWEYHGASSAGDKLIIDGIYSFKNKANIFGDTNKKLIILEKGWNQFNITGQGEKFNISFENKFYYY